MLTNCFRIFLFLRFYFLFILVSIFALYAFWFGVTVLREKVLRPGIMGLLAFLGMAAALAILTASRCVPWNCKPSLTSPASVTLIRPEKRGGVSGLWLLKRARISLLDFIYILILFLAERRTE